MAYPVVTLHPLVWLPEDALAFRCTVEEVGTLRKGAREGHVEPPGDANADESTLRGDQALARRLAPLALLHLSRLAAGEGRAAVEACRELLDRAYGPPVVSGGNGSDLPSTPLDPWLASSRLTYQKDNDVPN